MIVRRIPRYREPVRCVHAGHAQINIPDLIDGFITWQSTLPCRTNQETPFVDERVFQNRGVCEQTFPSLLSPPPPRTFLRPPQFSRGQKSEKCIERAESLNETLATQASLIKGIFLTTLLSKNTYFAGSSVKKVFAFEV